MFCSLLVLTDHVAKGSFHFANSNVGVGPIVQIKDDGNLETNNWQLEQGIVEEYICEPWILLSKMEHVVILLCRQGKHEQVGE